MSRLNDVFQILLLSITPSEMNMPCSPSVAVDFAEGRIQLHSVHLLL